MTVGEGIFDRSEMLIGREGQEALARSAVAVLGVGGVGGFAVEMLARAGIGRLILVDPDRVAPSNLNRQIIALEDTIGQFKTQAAAERVAKINRACAVTQIREFLSGESDFSFLDGADFCIDAIDTVSAKIALCLACREKGIPLVSAMGCGNRMDASKLALRDIYETSHCPLCAVMRRELRRRGVPSLAVVASSEAPKKPAGSRAPGSMAFAPAAAGILLANHVVLRLLEGER